MNGPGVLGPGSLLRFVKVIRFGTSLRRSSLAAPAVLRNTQVIFKALPHEAVTKRISGTATRVPSPTSERAV